MEIEVHSITTNNVWTLAEPSNGLKPINCKWIFKKKIGPNGTVLLEG